MHDRATCQQALGVPQLRPLRLVIPKPGFAHLAMFDVALDVPGKCLMSCKKIAMKSFCPGILEK